MAESAQHSELVSLIVERVRADHGHHDGLSMLVDSGPVPIGRKPQSIGGYCPDVEARTVPASFVILGEAKAYNDVFLPHTSRQITAYLEYLVMQAKPMLIVAVPFGALNSMRATIRRIQRRTNTASVPTIFLYD